MGCHIEAVEEELRCNGFHDEAMIERVSERGYPGRV